MRADAIADTIHESNKSLTRYNDDADLEAMRKAEYRGSEDTMGAYIMKKKRKEKGIVNGKNMRERVLYLSFMLLVTLC